MSRIPFLMIALATLAGCQSMRTASPARAPAAEQAASVLEGVYDNHEQVWTAREQSGVIAPPHLRIGIEATSEGAWTLWQVQLDAGAPLDASWAMRRVAEGDGRLVLLPHRALVAAPARGKAFDARQWAPLDACALRGEGGPVAMRASAEPAACAALAPGIGTQAALLPLSVERDGEWLRVRLYADQARGPDAREDARKVRVYGGWAAVNGGGRDASADSRDWHMDRSIRLASEGGRAALTWRDGQPSGYSLLLERLTYRDGNVPVLKLSVLEDATGRSLAYAWANPEATRIGINLGWVQVGLERDAAAP
jgi:hypothetical protein